jgi:hypothetical protein
MSLIALHIFSAIKHNAGSQNPIAANSKVQPKEENMLTKLKTSVANPKARKRETRPMLLPKQNI